jgi:nickel transport protein
MSRLFAALLALTFALSPLPALAHKVIASVFPSGSAIEGEIGFSNGDMAVGKTVQVYDEAGTLLGETVTDEDGFFIYTPTSPVTHIFRADLGAGHVASAEMPAAEVAALMGKEVATASTAPAPTQTAAAPQSLSDEAKSEIARIVRDEMRPLRREIAALREHRDLQSILGGIGYIIGLFGFGFYLAARRKLGG